MKVTVLLFLFSMGLFSVYSPHSYASDTIEPEQPLPLPPSLHSSRSALKPLTTSQQEDNQLEAITLYLTIIREDDKNSWAPYQLASTLAAKGQREMAERYLKLSSQRGLWYYYNLLEDPAFSGMHDSPVFQQVLADTKVRYLQKARDSEGKAFDAVPAGKAPENGWPVIVYLHNFGDSARISDEKKNFYRRLGYAYIEINGSQMLSENSYRWSTYNAESTQRIVQSSLEGLAQKTPLNRQQVYLIGHGQGALHAANLLADYPHDYAGGLIISPYGTIKSASTTESRNKRLFLVSYTNQETLSRDYLSNFKRLFSPHNQVYEGRYLADTDTVKAWEDRFYHPLLWITGKEGPQKLPGAHRDS